MYVQDVLRFDKSGKEAELIVSDGACEVLCYSYPIDAVKTGMTVSGLSGFSCTNMVRALNSAAPFQNCRHILLIT